MNKQRLTLFLTMVLVWLIGGLPTKLRKNRNTFMVVGVILLLVGCSPQFHVNLPPVTSSTNVAEPKLEKTWFQTEKKPEYPVLTGVIDKQIDGKFYTCFPNSESKKLGSYVVELERQNRIMRAELITIYKRYFNEDCPYE
jgi:hypothetical protein